MSDPVPRRLLSDIPLTPPAGDRAAATADDSVRIVISYRREDTAGHAGHLYADLTEHFGAVFMDIDAIEPGSDFTEVISDAISRCDVLIAMIGKGWLTATDRNGRRRIEKEDDFVRLELASALERKVRVVPVLVQEAEMPTVDELPPPLAGLARRHAIDLSDRRWRTDVAELIQALKAIAREKAQREGPSAAADQSSLDAARQEEARLEADRQEEARLEAARQEAARQEEARVEAARQEEARQEEARLEAARQEEARQAEAREHALRQQALRDQLREQAAREQALRDQLRDTEAARQEMLREQARLESVRREAEAAPTAARGRKAGDRNRTAAAATGAIPAPATAPAYASATTPASAPATGSERDRRRPSWLLPVVALVAVLVVVALVFALGGNDPDDPNGPTDTRAAPTVTTFEVPGTVPWNDTGVRLRQGQTVEITAVGTVATHESDPSRDTGPDGKVGEENGNNVVMGVRHGALIRRIGTGDPVGVGAHSTFTAESDGVLYLGVNDIDLATNAGYFTATIEVS